MARSGTDSLVTSSFSVSLGIHQPPRRTIDRKASLGYYNPLPTEILARAKESQPKLVSATVYIDDFSLYMSLRGGYD